MAKPWVCRARLAPAGWKIRGQKKGFRPWNRAVLCHQAFHMKIKASLNWAEWPSRAQPRLLGIWLARSLARGQVKARAAKA